MQSSRSSGLRAALAIAALGAGLGALGDSTQRAADSAQRFADAATRPDGARQPLVDGRQRGERSTRFMGGLGRAGAPAAPCGKRRRWSVAQDHRNAAKRRNVLRNRKAHR